MGFIVKHKNKRGENKSPSVCNHSQGVTPILKPLALPRFEIHYNAPPYCSKRLGDLSTHGLLYLFRDGGASTVLNSLTDAMHNIAASLKRYAFAPYNPYSPSLTCPKPRATAIGCFCTLLHASHHRCTPTD